MRNLAEDLAWLHQRASVLLVRDARWRRILQVGFVLGGAALGGIGEVVANIVADPLRPYAHIASIVGLVAVLIGGLVFAFVDEGAPETIARALAAIEGARGRDLTIVELEAEFRWITQLYGTAKALREFVEAAPDVGAEEAKTAVMGTLSALLDMVVAQKDVLFGMTGERWNFAIYLYDRIADRLDCLICRRPIRAEETAPHRAWQPGEGHVGLAFSRARSWLPPTLQTRKSSNCFAATVPSIATMTRPATVRSRRSRSARAATIPGACSSQPATGPDDFGR